MRELTELLTPPVERERRSRNDVPALPRTLAQIHIARNPTTPMQTHASRVADKEEERLDNGRLKRAKLIASKNSRRSDPATPAGQATSS